MIPTRLLSTHSTDDQIWDVWCHFKALLDQWNDKSTRISAYFQETAGRLFNCWGDNESVSLMESFFHNVAAFCLSDLAFSLGYGKCSNAQMTPVILCQIGLDLAGATSKQLHENWSQLRFNQSNGFSAAKLGFCKCSHYSPRLTELFNSCNSR